VVLRISGLSSFSTMSAVGVLAARTLKRKSVGTPSRSPHRSMTNVSPFLAAKAYQSRSPRLSIRPATSHGAGTSIA